MLNKEQFVDKVVDKAVNVSKLDTARVIDSALEVLRDELSTGEGVQIYGFGTLETVMHAPRTGRNPATGELVTIPEKRAVRFRAGKNLKELVAGKA